MEILELCIRLTGDGKPVVHDRMHWTLAEAINTSAVLWHITHKQKYAKDYEEFMRYLDDKVLDHKKWFLVSSVR